MGGGVVRNGDGAGGGFGAAPAATGFGMKPAGGGLFGAGESRWMKNAAGLLFCLCHCGVTH